MSSNYKAINNYIVVENIKEEQVVRGMALPGSESAMIRPQKGKVIICPEELKGISEGRIIIYDTARAVPFVLNGDVLTIIRTQEIILLCPPEAS